MDFREMTYILTLAECGSVTKAAQRLFISQPSLSNAIAKIEAEEGVTLFDRSRLPFTLTYAGEIYVKNAQRILQIRKNLSQQLSDIKKGDKAFIQFGIPTERDGYRMPKIMRHYKDTYPGVEFRLVNGSSEQLLDALEKEKINFAILPKSATEIPSNFVTEKLYVEPLYTVAAPGYLTPEPAARQIPLSYFEKFPLIAMRKGHSIRTKMEHIFREHHISYRMTMEMNSCQSAAQFAAAGLGIAIVPLRAILVPHLQNELILFTTGTSLDSWTINLIYKRDTYLTHHEHQFIGKLQVEFEHS